MRPTDPLTPPLAPLDDPAMTHADEAGALGVAGDAGGEGEAAKRVGDAAGGAHGCGCP